MNNLHINQTDSSLLIDFDVQKGELMLKGESRPENCSEFFNPISKWLENYKVLLAQGDNKKVFIKFHLDYFNSTSAKYLTDIFLILKEIQTMSHVDLIIEWHYKSIDEEILESGEDFKVMSGVDMNFLPFK